MSTKYGQMASPRVIGPMSGFATIVARRPLPLEAIPVPSAIYWPSHPVGSTATPGTTSTLANPPATPPATSSGGSCCGQ